MGRVLLIDGFNAIHRANIKFKQTTVDDKKSFTVVFNFFRQLKSTVENLQPNHIFFVLEGRPHFRYALYPEYKANRLVKNAAAQTAKESLLEEKDVILKLLKFLPITFVRHPAAEADDVIATLTKNLSTEEVIILSNDSDYTQLLQEFSYCKIFNPIKKEWVAIPAYSYLAYKCLAGDKSDNIPGIVSEKEAIRLAGNPSALYSFVSQEENRANFSLNRELIQFKILPEEELEITSGNLNFNMLFSEFKTLELNSLLTDKYIVEFTSVFEKVK